MEQVRLVIFVGVVYGRLLDIKTAIQASTLTFNLSMDEGIF